MESSNTKLENLILQLHNRTNEVKETFDQALAELERQKAENEKEYNAKLEQLNEERRKWTEEKMTMEELAASASPIVNLNVGGEIITTLRATLTLAEGSLLATMFSGKWEDKLMKDANGHIFLDYDPVLFKYLLNQLRAWSDPSVKRGFRLPVGAEQPTLDFIRLLKFDNRFIDSKQNTNTDSTGGIQSESKIERFKEVSNSAVQVTDNGRRCKKTGEKDWQCVFGTQMYSTGIHKIRLRLENGTTNILIGICSQSKPPSVSPFYNQPTTHGWFIHGYVITNGQGSHPGWSQVLINDILELTIDCEKRSLSILNETSRAQHSIQVDITGTPFPWCLLILFDQINSQICLV